MVDVQICGTGATLAPHSLAFCNNVGNKFGVILIFC